MTTGTLKEQIMEAFIISERHFDNNCSDLYVKKSDEVVKWLAKNYEFYKNINVFVNQLDGNLWLDIPFGYPEYYDE